MQYAYLHEFASDETYFPRACNRAGENLEQILDLHNLMPRISNENLDFLVSHLHASHCNKYLPQWLQAQEFIRRCVEAGKVTLQDIEKAKV